MHYGIYRHVLELGYHPLLSDLELLQLLQQLTLLLDLLQLQKAESPGQSTRI